MFQKGVTACLLGGLATGMVGCGGLPPAPSGNAMLALPEAPLLRLPMEMHEAELVAPARVATDEALHRQGWRGGSGYRFRRILIGREAYYVPYDKPSASPHYVPYYQDYDPSYYYVSAYAEPDLGARSLLVRYGRRGGG